MAFQDIKDIKDISEISLAFFGVPVNFLDRLKFLTHQFHTLQLGCSFNPIVLFSNFTVLGGFLEDLQ